VVEAVSRGATDGVKLAINIGAMLVAFVAMVALVNFFLGLAGTNLEEILGWIFRPIAFFMGAPWEESKDLGMLLGEKIALTELYAFKDLADPEKAGIVLSERTRVIASYALCGFANFASVGIQIGGIGGIAPERRKDIARISMKALIGGALASWTTACIAGVLL
jgi:CNT family concentrative nucleoside transporter